MVFRPCSPRGSEWPSDYRAYAVELHREFEAGVITKQEAQLRLADKFPDYDLPDDRTWRRWAREKYSDLPERRRQFFNPQEADWGFRQPALQPSAGSLNRTQMPVFPLAPSVTLQPIPAVQNWAVGFEALTGWLIFCIVVGMWASMTRLVITSL
jgi:hypothetical protein